MGKMIVSVLLAAVLLLAMTCSATAEVSDVLYDTGIKYSVTMLANGIIADSATGSYTFYDVTGKQLTDQTWTYCSMNSDNGYTRVAFDNGDAYNCVGLLTAEGLAVPAEYGMFDIYGKWVFAHKTEAATSDAYDYVDYTGTYYTNGVTTDVYYDGALVLNLTDADVKRVAAYGDYIRVSYNEGGYDWFDKTGANTAHYTDSEGYYEYNNGVHNATGAAAFTADCTLNADEVNQHIWYNPETGDILDLQGNVLGNYTQDESFNAMYAGDNFYSKYTDANGDIMYFLVNAQGKRVLEDLCYESSFLVDDETGNIAYAAGNSRNLNALGWINADGETITAMDVKEKAGESVHATLYDHFILYSDSLSYTYFMSDEGYISEQCIAATPYSSYIVQQKADGFVLLDTAGNALLSSAKSITVSADGKYAFAYNEATASYCTYALTE